MQVEYTVEGRITRISQDEIVGSPHLVISVDRFPDPVNEMVVDGALTPRPKLNFKPASFDGGFELIGVPEGTIITLIGPLGLTSDSITVTMDPVERLTVHIPVTGNYQIRFEPPWPYAEAVYNFAAVGGSGPAISAATHIEAPTPMEDLKNKAIRLIDELAEELSQLIITPGTAMAMIYMRKEVQAAAVLDLPDPDAADPAVYSLVASEASYDGVSMRTAAEVINTRALAFEKIGSVWDQLRLEAKKSVRDATTVAEIDSAVVLVNQTEFLNRIVAAGIDPALVLNG